MHFSFLAYRTKMLIQVLESILILKFVFPQAFTVATERRKHTVDVKGEPHPEV